MLKTIIARNPDPADQFCLGIVIKPIGDDPGFDPVRAVRNAAADYVRENKLPDETPFNWGDFVDVMTPTLCARHGFLVHDTFVTSHVVEHNESLRPDAW